MTVFFCHPNLLHSVFFFFIYVVCKEGASRLLLTPPVHVQQNLDVQRPPLRPFGGHLFTGLARFLGRNFAPESRPTFGQIAKMPFLAFLGQKFVVGHPQCPPVNTHCHARTALVIPRCQQPQHPAGQQRVLQAGGPAARLLLQVPWLLQQDGSPVRGGACERGADLLGRCAWHPPFLAHRRPLTVWGSGVLTPPVWGGDPELVSWHYCTPAIYTYIHTYVHRHTHEPHPPTHTCSHRL